jgi:hypothetical protein
MIDITTFEPEEIQEVSQIVLKSVERSDLERYFLFTQNHREKANIFVLCYRLLVNASRVVENKKVKQALKSEAELLYPLYVTVQSCLTKLRLVQFNSHLSEVKLARIMESNSDVDNLIDLFSVLTERSIQIEMAKTRMFLTEGESGREYSKIFGDNNKDADLESANES